MYSAVQLNTSYWFYKEHKQKLSFAHAKHHLLAPLQLSSVNSFLESINDYLRLKDDELALTISAQRLEGYEVEGINEEIDKVIYDC